ncbi:murein biosynthesis integral membrane protein MurJ [Helicobacter monodelphidis]|uniref:murein biosynthesis integral membrane protein MurJ n=1 Tax=Helicobacter sp. 15-1451 TaxID=2004995 RepID=UPI000DCDC63C|nr:murein biosynthesis integral membrane protein MurJ [Helicobacter sp. 15-1451]RAX57680.1 murein biosynthesis integral membrane protein MurJ [Helicobacter sp. 15-1451]
MFFRSFFSNSSGILFSRITGFLRDMMMSHILGVSIYSDLFLIAFKIPNVFRRIFAEGAFNQAFLPSFVAAKFKGAFTLRIAFIFLSIIIALSIMVSCFAPSVSKILALGLKEEEIAIVAPLVMINFWYLPLIFIVALLGAILQYKNNFIAAAYSTIFLNLSMVVALWLTRNHDAFEIVLWLSYSTLIGGVLQILLHFYPLKKLGFCAMFMAGFTHLRRKKNEVKKDIKHFSSQFFPAMVGGSTVQIASIIDIQLASFLAEGSISYLHYANRIFQLPLALFAIATSIALYPMVVKAINQNDEQRAIIQLKKAFWFLLYTLCGCCIAGIMLSHEIVWILFERGSFNAQDSLQTGIVLSAYLIGLIPFGIARIFSLWLYSHHQQLLAAKISIKSLLIGTISSVVLMWEFGAFGLALAGSISGFALLYWSIQSFGFRKFWAIIASRKQWLFLGLLILVEIPTIWFVKQGLNWIYQTYY